MCGRKILCQWLWHSLAKLCTKNNENPSIICKSYGEKISGTFSCGHSVVFTKFERACFLVISCGIFFCGCLRITWHCDLASVNHNSHLRVNFVLYWMGLATLKPGLLIWLRRWSAKGKGKGAYSSSWNSPQNYGTPLVNRSHSVICHPTEVTAPPSPQPGRLVLDLSTP